MYGMNLQAGSTIMRKAKKTRVKDFFKQIELQSMIWPGIIFILLFNIVPMYGVLIAFKNYGVSMGITGIFSSQWVGLKYFKQFFVDENFILVLRNTLAISFLRLFISFPIPILFSLLLNEITHKKFKKITQTISYLPHFISWVVFGGLVIQFLSPDGIINSILVGLGIVKSGISFLSEPGYFWMVLIVSGIIKGLGFGSIIYIAAITSVDQEIYESAIIDGAGRFKRMRYITLPCISGTIVIMFLLEISSILSSNFDAVWMLQNNLNLATAETIDTYVYKLGFQKMRYSYSTAVGLFQSVVGLILLYTGNFIARKYGDRGLF